VGRLELAVERAYEVMARYASRAPPSFCEFCWDAAEVERLHASPLHDLDVELSRKLVWEASDHWPSEEVYKHFLPRILEVMTPAFGVEDLFPEHLFDVVRAQGFPDWPESEQSAVREWVAAMESTLDDDRARQEWRAAATSLDAPRIIVGAP
jgi:hypothetical protein